MAFKTELNTVKPKMAENKKHLFSHDREINAFLLSETHDMLKSPSVAHFVDSFSTTSSKSISSALQSAVI